MRRRLTLAAVACVTAAGALVTAAMPAQAAPLPIRWDWGTQFVPNIPNSATPPPGAENVSDGHRSTCNWQASPTKRPLILVHGTWENQSDNWQAISPYFKNNGFCVYTLNYGGNKGDTLWGYKSIAASAGELSLYVDKVLASTGATKVDIVGHSQGGAMPRYYTKFLGGASKVDSFVGLAGSNNGTTLNGLANLGSILGLLPAISSIQPAAIDQTIGSPFMQKLNSCPSGKSFNVCTGDPVKYTSIETNGDQVVTPYTGAFLSTENTATTSVKNIEVNKECILELAEHLGMTYSQNVASRALRALVPSTKAICKLSTPYSGG